MKTRMKIRYSDRGVISDSNRCVSMTNVIVAVTTLRFSFHLFFGPSTSCSFVGSLLLHPPNRYERSIYRVPATCFNCSLSCFHLGHSIRKCFTVSRCSHMQYSEGDALIFTMYP